MVGAEPEAGLGGRRTEAGKAPSWDPRAVLAVGPSRGRGGGVMRKGGVVINQEKNKIIK